MRFVAWTVCALALLVVAGCKTPQSLRRAQFKIEEYEPYGVKGTASISGQAFMQRGGDVVTAAGSDVWLNPVTSYSKEWYNRVVVAGESLESPDPRARDFHWSTTADADGRFALEELPPGAYYLVTYVTWRVPTDVRFAHLHRVVILEDGEQKKVTLSR